MIVCLKCSNVFILEVKTRSSNAVEFWSKSIVIIQVDFLLVVWSFKVFPIRFYHLDNDKPVLTPSVISPVEGIHNVTLTCSAATSDNVTGYVFYKNNVQISVSTSSNYLLPNNSRTDDGNYTCEVTTSKAPRSPKADEVAVKFLCKLP